MTLDAPGSPPGFFEGPASRARVAADRVALHGCGPPTRGGSWEFEGSLRVRGRSWVRLTTTCSWKAPHQDDVQAPRRPSGDSTRGWRAPISPFGHPTPIACRLWAISTEWDGRLPPDAPARRERVSGSYSRRVSKPGTIYKYEILGQWGRLQPLEGRSCRVPAERVAPRHRLHRGQAPRPSPGRMATTWPGAQKVDRRRSADDHLRGAPRLLEAAPMDNRLPHL